jgi:hypothetical protein
MARTVSQTVYPYSELSRDAQAVALNWYREIMDSSDYADAVIEDAKNVAEILGITFETDSSGLPEIHWSGFGSQGDGASFDGDYAFKAGACAAVTEYAPQDAELRSIAEGLQTLFDRHGAISASVYLARGLSRYVHSGHLYVDLDPTPDGVGLTVNWDEASDDLLRLMRRFADWIYRQLEAEHDATTSDEPVAESIVANEYEFTADGRRYSEGA